MEFLLGLVTGYLFSIPGMIALVVLGILFEHSNHRGWAVFTAIVSMVGAYFVFNVSLQTIAIAAVSYIVIGLAWSIYRYKRHVRAEVDRIKRVYLHNYEGKETAIQRLHPSRMVETLTAWIIIWPFSFIEHLIGDVLDFIQLLVTKYFRSVYVCIWLNTLHDSGLNEPSTKKP